MCNIQVHKKNVIYSRNHFVYEIIRIRSALGINAFKLFTYDEALK